MNSDDDSRSIVPLPDVSLAIARPHAGRVLSEMVGETLALARRESLVTSGEYVNSLGMKFVPVAGANVLFSVWETRVQDYGVFAKEAGRKLYRPSIPQEPTHPVVQVSWDDAVAFCTWLSKKEGRTYRLPTDAEWSVAVGLGVEKGRTPKEKALKVAGYPWGEAWPPPRGAGNYNPDLEVDDFEYTSPVGSFAANAFGLYDLGGNVWELCEDWYDDEKTHRVLRGGSRLEAMTFHLSSSSRYHVLPSSRSDDDGFRCVLVVSGHDTQLAVDEMVESSLALAKDVALASDEITTLDCNGDQLTNLDLSNVPKLTMLWCGENQLTELDLSHVPKLTMLWCSGNQLTQLNVSQLPNLTALYCDRNQLTALNLSQIPNLDVLYCDGNQLMELDLTQVPNLTELCCSENRLTELDIRPLLSLEKLIYDNRITRLVRRPDQDIFVQ